jgi:uncharacterized protein (DUF1697 family)
MPTTWVALLRGVNVSGKNMLPMKELEAALVGIGFTGVRTYIQSGNVLFSCRSGVEKTVIGQIETLLADEFGLKVPVVVRAVGDLRKVVGANPYATAEADLTKLQIAFLGAAPEKAAVEKLDPKRSPPDRFEVRGREIYMECPNGFGRTKLTIDYFERVLGTTATARNWKTVNALAEWAAR